jgi:SAM-dependent methyltransferase
VGFARRAQVSTGASEIASLMVCPYDGLPLSRGDRVLRCPNKHAFPIVDDVPVLLRSDVPHTIALASNSLREAWADVEGRNADPWFVDTLGISDEQKNGVRMAASCGDDVDPVVSHLVAATNGILYKHVVGLLHDYPIPKIRLAAGQGKVLLDIGCSWGRWSMAAAKRGYMPVGLDPSLGAILAAKRVANSLSLPFHGVVADARFLPFRDGSFDVAFSYSVLQHFSKGDAQAAMEDIRRVLHADGTFLVQMASALGIRSIQHQMRRGFREPKDFDVRYWTPPELLRTFRDIFGPTELEVDCYFGLGLQPADVALMSGVSKLLIYASEALRTASKTFKPMIYLADSLYLRSARCQNESLHQI